MALAEHSLTHMLRNSGDVLAELDEHDVVIRRRDGEDLYISVRSREGSLQEALHVLGILLASLTDEPDIARRIVDAMADSLPWTSFLPEPERAEFLADLARVSAACVELQSYEPLGHVINSWRATADVYANPELMKLLRKHHRGPTFPLRRPQTD